MNENEKVYRSVSSAGACDIAVGVIVLVVGIVAGVISIVNGARLLMTRKNILL